MLTFDELLSQVIDLLQRQGRISYGALKRRFALDDEYLQDLKTELIDAQQVASDEDGKVLVWGGASPVSGSQFQVPGFQPPAANTETLDPRQKDSRLAAGERRQLTVMFCELGKTTAVGAQRDPEEWREALLVARRASEEVINRYEGYVAQYIGDGLLVYWGYPTAHEDDAHRSVLAGLDIIRSIQQLDYWQIAGTPTVQVRIGIHTGLVIVDADDDREGLGTLARGDTPQVALRLLDVAEPNTVVLGATTFRLVAGYFSCRSLGERTVRGLPEAIESYQVLNESGARNRLEAALVSGFTPFVGRGEESRLFLKRWEQVREGHGQVVLLSGEAGIGKSRLIQKMKESLADEQIIQFAARCSPYHQQSAFYPVVDYLQRALQFGREETGDAKRLKLERALLRSHLEEELPLFAALLSLPLSSSAQTQLTPQRQREKLLRVIVSWLLSLAERQPVLTVWEDLHWADPSTLELLQLLIEQLPTARILAVFTFRPEFTPPWPPRSHLTPLTLTRLAHKEAEAMVEGIARGKTLPAEVLQQIVSRTDGIPLFVEELTKMVLESGLVREEKDRYHLRGPLPPLAIPVTLQDSLFARLDRLSAVREVAQVAAVLGREFTPEVLHAVLGGDRPPLQQALEKLVEAEVLYRRGVEPQVHYIFKHALIQDAAYQSLLKGRRQHYHQRVAQVLEAQFADVASTQPELIAHHYTAAGIAPLAIPAWQRAAQNAIARSAFVEASEHLSKGLEVLQTLPETPERSQQELDLHTILGPTLMALKGYGAPEVEKSYARALALCRQGGESSRLLRVLSGLEMFYLTRGEVRTACELGEQCLTLATQTNNPGRLLQTHLLLGNTLFHMGEFTRAREHLSQGFALYQQQLRGSQRALQDPGVDCLCYIALVLWCLGYPDQALQKSQEALALAEKLTRPLSRVIALSFAAELHQFRREGLAARQHAEAAITVANEHGLSLWVAYSEIYRGWALTEQGQENDGIAQMQRGLAVSRATGAEVVQPWFLAMLAGVYAKLTQSEEGLRVVQDAFQVMEKKGERMAETELYRIKGELTLQQQFQVPSSKFQVSNPQPLTPNPQHPTPSTQAEAYFLRAIDIARQRGAKSFELRATVSLARLWQQQGKQHAARNTLSEIYGWFTEGFATADLQEAKHLLAEMARS